MSNWSGVTAKILSYFSHCKALRNHASPSTVTSHPIITMQILTTIQAQTHRNDPTKMSWLICCLNMYKSKKCTKDSTASHVSSPLATQWKLESRISLTVLTHSSLSRDICQLTSAFFTDLFSLTVRLYAMDLWLVREYWTSSQ